MKTQISKNSRNPNKRYSGVYQQQGRMLTDADWNELAELVKERVDESLRDVIGSGSPRERGMVEVAPGSGETVALRWGRVYVDGVSAEVRPKSPAAASTAFVYEAQADFPQPPPTPGEYRLYLDVWERVVTSLEDGDLRDPGLHGADTCTRTQTMAQVKWCPLNVNPEKPAVNPSRGSAGLSLELRQGSAEPDPCDPCADEVALQQRVGNYLFRVEVHDVVVDADGKPERLVLKWSSENGAEEYPVGSEPPGFKSSRWAFEFFSGADAGFASEKHLGVHLTGGEWTPIRGALTTGYPAASTGFSQVRRWDGYCALERVGEVWTLATDDSGAVLGSDRGVPLSTSSASDAPGHVSLGPSLEIHLDALVLTLTLDGATFVAGDYWYAVVREAVHRAGDTLLSAALPVGIIHHYMGLAEVTGTPPDTTITLYSGAQCQRSPFPPLTNLRADDICYDGKHIGEDADTVQEAIDELYQRDKDCCAITVRPGVDWESVFANIPEGGDAHLCFQVGTYPLTKPVRVTKKRHIRISGCGAGSVIIAPDAEAALVFDEIATVAVSDIRIETGATGTSDDHEHLNGSLTFIDCDAVTVLATSVKCGADVERRAACITIRRTQPLASSSARVAECQLAVGHGQTGILTVNVAHVHIERNHVAVYAKPARLSVPRLLERRDYRKRVARSLVRNVLFGAPPSDGIAGNVTFYDQRISFSTESQLVQGWNALIAVYPPPVITARAIRLHLIGLADRILAGKLPVPPRGGHVFRAWLERMMTMAPASAGQGIVIAASSGGGTRTARVTDNMVTNAMQGIHVGASHSTSGHSRATALMADRVTITGNSVHVRLPFDAARERHGIFVGNSASTLIENNHLQCEALGAARNRPTDGIRLFGYFGRYIMIRQNHVIGFPIGIRVQSLDSVKGQPQWRAAENAVERSSQVISADSTSQLLSVSNYT